MVAFFVIAGTFHFIKTKFYLQIMPSYLPHPVALVYLSGVCEMLGGIGLLVPRCRRAAGYGLIALLLAVFPANIEMLRQNWEKEGMSLFTGALILRLPLQIIFIQLVNWVSRE